MSSTVLSEWTNVHDVSDLAEAMRDAKHAAGNANVLVHGAGMPRALVRR